MTTTGLCFVCLLFGFLVCMLWLGVALYLLHPFWVLVAPVLLVTELACFNKFCRFKKTTTTNGFFTSSWENHYPWFSYTPFNEQLAHMKPPTKFAQQLPFYYSSLIAGAAQPTANVKEYQDSFVLEIDMAGLKSGDIKVEIEEDNVLVISGERRREQGAKYLRMERKVGNLLRKFVVPENGDVSAVSAACLDGLLSVTIKKKLAPPETNKNKRIKVVGIA